MSRPATLALVSLFLGVTWAAPARAQEPATRPSPAAPGADSLKSIGTEMPGPEGYTYSPMGRRDPFVSLLKRVSPDEGTRTRRPGMEGFLIQEVALKGIVKTPKGYIAMLLGTDNKSYFVGVGQRLFDGVVTAIDATTVTFRQEVTDPLSTVKSRDVKKTLYPSEEARQ
jgi:Tfp pilus assembly protein PilP